MQYSTKRRTFKENQLYKLLKINKINGFEESTKKLYGKEVLDKLGIEHICEKAIHLLPDLIAK